MNAYERVMHTLQGLPADRVPVFAVLGAYGGKLTGTHLRTLYRDAAAYVAGQEAVQEAFGFDLVLAPFDYSALAEAFGGEAAFFDDQPPNVKRPAANSAAEACALSLPDPERTGRLPFIVEATRRLAGLYTGRVPVFAAVPGPAAFPSLLMGLDAWMETLLFNEVHAQALLELTGSFFVRWSNALLAAGATGLIVTEGMAAAEVSPRGLFAERLRPHLQAMCSQLRGPWVFHHTGGRVNQVLDLLPGLPNLVGVAVSSKDDLAEARRLIGPELLLIGNLDNLSYPAATAQQIREWSRACLEVAAPAGRFVLANSGGDIPLTTPPENLRAMIEASVAYAGRNREGA
ncbi:MAG: uroporphyrinogen decarboxylase family protein [Verrucomicrobiia bacterium]|jgi:uroporphyrinogen decarboxylase